MKFFPYNKGFTLIEMLVSLAIFALMTSLLLAKYGNFNQGVLLTNLAYDVALTIRNAQSYGLNAKSAQRNLDAFQQSTGGGSYGVHFTTTDKTHFTFFVDANNNGIYDDVGADLGVTSIKRGSSVSNLCVAAASPCGVGNNVTSLDISFVRPDPNAIIKSGGVTYDYAEITVKASDGTTRVISIRSNGQISVVALF